LAGGAVAGGAGLGRDPGAVGGRGQSSRCDRRVARKRGSGARNASRARARSAGIRLRPRARQAGRSLDRSFMLIGKGMAKNVVIIGTQWGDEGKGKIVDWLTESVSGVVRFQGGHNAGHTLVI